MAKAKFERKKPHLNVGTIGHVDHGKTTLTSALTKVMGDMGQATFVPYDEVAKASESQGDAIPPRFSPSLSRMWSMKPPTVITPTLIARAMRIMSRT